MSRLWTKALPALLGLALPVSLSAQDITAEPQVQLPSASIETPEELRELISAPAPQVNSQNSAFTVPSDKLLPEVLAAIAAEREQLSRRSQALDLREAEIAFAAAALSEQERQLSTLKGEIERLLKLGEGNHHEDVLRLVKIYRTMKPVEAAAILSTADLEVTVLVIAAMSERDSGPILAKMNQIRAQAVSKIILERSRLPGDQRLLNLRVN